MKDLVKRIFFDFSRLLKTRKAAVFFVWAVFLLVFFIPYKADASSLTQTAGSVLGSIYTSAEDYIRQIATWSVNLFIYIMGSFLTAVLIPVLIGIAQFNNFIGNPVVQIGWSLTRDIANMLFIVVLLIIAFSTMLRIQTYHYKQSLIKLIIMAVLVNFSKVISGVLIDFFQVIMLTFVRGFQGALGGNIIQAFRIYDMLAVAGGQGVAANTEISNMAIIAGLVLAAAGLTVVVISVLIMILVLLYRIIVLWLLVVLSPLAYFAYTIRPNYWSQWWSEFFKQLVTGPVIAFFLWLELKVAQDLGAKSLIGLGDSGKVAEYPFVSGFAVPEVFINYLTMISLMIAGLMVSQKMAQQTGGAVGNAAGKIQRFGTKAAVGLAGLTSGAWFAKKAGKAIGTSSLDVLSRSDRVKGTLGRVGTSRFGAFVPGLRRKAREGVIALDKRETALDNMYNSFVSSLPSATKRKIIHSSSRGWMKGERNRFIEAVRKNNPELINLKKEKSGKWDKSGMEIFQDTLSTMGPSQLNSLKPQQWRAFSSQLKESGVYSDADTFMKDVITKNSDGKYKYGEKLANHLEHNLGVQRAIRIGFDPELATKFNPAEAAYYRDFDRKASGDSSGTTRPTRLADSEEVDREMAKPEAERNIGAGNLSIDRFGRGQSDNLAVDFAALGFDNLKDEKGRFAGVKGITYRNKKDIAAVARKMVGTESEPGIIDKEIASEEKILAKNKAEGKSTAGSEKQIKEMQAAKLRFARVLEDPENQTEIEELAMENSAAVGYKNISDVKRTIREEDLHRLIGNTDMTEEEEEGAVKHAVEQMMHNLIFRSSDVAKIAEAIKQAGSGADHKQVVDNVVQKIKQSRAEEKEASVDDSSLSPSQKKTSSVKQSFDKPKTEADREVLQNQTDKAEQALDNISSQNIEFSNSQNFDALISELQAVRNGVENLVSEGIMDENPIPTLQSQETPLQLKAISDAIKNQGLIFKKGFSSLRDKLSFLK